MKIPKKCPYCNEDCLHSETGFEVLRFFYRGYKTSEVKRKLPKRVFCDSCFKGVFEK